MIPSLHINNKGKASRSLIIAKGSFVNDRVGQWAGPSGYGVGSSSPSLVYNIQDEFIEFKELYFHVKLLLSFKSNEMDIIKKYS